MNILTKGKYYGNRNTEISYNGVLISHYTYDTPNTDWHYHENPYFMYVIQGNMKDRNAKQENLCPPGSLMYNNWQEPHYGSKHSDKASGFHLEFERTWLQDKGLSSTILEGSQRVENPRVHVLFAQLFNEFMVSDTFSEVSVEVLLLQVCEALSDVKEKDTQPAPSWVERLKELLHYDSSELSLAYLANQLNIHPVHISRAASKHLSMNLGEYIRLQKIKKAIPLLFDSSHSLTEISYQAGFADQSHFNRVFKSYFNMNPGQYRKVRTAW
ncbi:MAG: AraC family transcriptional regulator [Bacteroidota bacterium]